MDCELKIKDKLKMNANRSSDHTDLSTDRNHQSTEHHSNSSSTSRYSRQILLPEIGLKGQQKISQSSVLIIGAGGLGAPCAAYLAGAGIGKIGIVDWDCVEESNLHRQIAHSESRLGMSKVASLAAFIRGLNSHVQVEEYKMLFKRENALKIIESWDVVVDASDNVPTRYLVNDCCVLLGKPLVSASALRWEGHVTVWGSRGEGPCYRCVFPKPPPAECVVGCGAGGILGPVTGVLGSMQAMEVIKIVIGGVEAGVEPLYGQMMLLNGVLGKPVRMLKLRGKQADCAVCGTNPRITDPAKEDYEGFCGGAKAHDLSDERISWEEYKNEYEGPGKEHQLIDVRDSMQFQAFHLPQAINIPISELQERAGDELSLNVPVVCLCQRGVSSLKAVEILKREGFSKVKDIVGGISAYE